MGEGIPRRYHGPVWSEPLILEMTSPGERGIMITEVDEEIKKAVGDVSSLVPASAMRKRAPGLPELSQAKVLRHYLRLSQMTLGMELDIDLGVGTCTSPPSTATARGTDKLVCKLSPCRSNVGCGLTEITR